MKKTFELEDLDCANCAMKMQEAIEKIPGVISCSVNFMTQKMIVVFEDGAEPEAVMQDVLVRCKKVEDDCEIYL